MKLLRACVAVALLSACDAQVAPPAASTPKHVYALTGPAAVNKPLEVGDGMQSIYGGLLKANVTAVQDVLQQGTLTFTDIVDGKATQYVVPATYRVQQLNLDVAGYLGPAPYGKAIGPKIVARETVSRCPDLQDPSDPVKMVQGVGTLGDSQPDGIGSCAWTFASGTAGAEGFNARPPHLVGEVIYTVADLPLLGAPEQLAYLGDAMVVADGKVLVPQKAQALTTAAGQPAAKPRPPLAMTTQELEAALGGLQAAVLPVIAGPPKK